MENRYTINIVRCNGSFLDPGGPGYKARGPGPVKLNTEICLHHRSMSEAEYIPCYESQQKQLAYRMELRLSLAPAAFHTGICVQMRELHIQTIGLG